MLWSCFQKIKQVGSIYSIWFVLAEKSRPSDCKRHDLFFIKRSLNRCLPSAFRNVTRPVSTIEIEDQLWYHGNVCNNNVQIQLKIFQYNILSFTIEITRSFWFRRHSGRLEECRLAFLMKRVRNDHSTWRSILSAHQPLLFWLERLLDAGSAQVD